MKFIETHMCRFGMTGRDHLGQGLVKKPTGFLTDCPALARTLDRKCTGDHRHLSSLNAGGLAQFAIYPPRLCQAIVAGLMRQLKIDAKHENAQSLNTPVLALPDPEEDEEMLDLCAESDDENPENLVAFDDVKGGELPVDLVKKARAVEMEFVKEREIYEYRPVSECIKKTGKPPVGVKWVDTNKGDDEQPLVRSRLVAMEFKRSWIAKWFAATPPMEAIRVLLVIAASGCSEGQPPRKLLHIDVSRKRSTGTQRPPVTST